MNVTRSMHKYLPEGAAEAAAEFDTFRGAFDEGKGDFADAIRVAMVGGICHRVEVWRNERANEYAVVDVCEAPVEAVIAFQAAFTTMASAMAQATREVLRAYEFVEEEMRAGLRHCEEGPGVERCANKATYIVSLREHKDKPTSEFYVTVCEFCLDDAVEAFRDNWHVAAVNKFVK